MVNEKSQTTYRSNQFSIFEFELPEEIRFFSANPASQVLPIIWRLFQKQILTEIIFLLISITIGINFEGFYYICKVRLILI